MHNFSIDEVVYKKATRQAGIELNVDTSITYQEFPVSNCIVKRPSKNEPTDIGNEKRDEFKIIFMVDTNTEDIQPGDLFNVNGIDYRIERFTYKSRIAGFKTVMVEVVNNA